MECVVVGSSPCPPDPNPNPNPNPNCEETALGPVPAPRRAHSCVVVGNHAVMMFGMSAGGLLSDVHVLSVDSELAWSSPEVELGFELRSRLGSGLWSSSDMI